ncbi:hypothetical protein EIP86_002761 [Pleurotus ostreatoroseus]|nr:hypothetical protein EIP86_002761 [Pleurotus ostreatoroseus]
MPATKDSPLPPIPQEAPKGGLFKRFTTKLHRPHAPVPPHRSFSVPTRPTPLTATQPPASTNPDDVPRRKTTLKLPSLPKPSAPRPTRQNEFTSQEHREAALRARGLVPARYRDKAGFTLPLSEQELQMDQRFSVLMEEPSTEGSDGETEAKRIREAWLQRNVANSVGCSESEEESVADHAHAVFGNSRAPLKPQLVKEHPTPPVSPSYAEYGDASPKRSQQRTSQDPAATVLPSSPTSPRSVRSGGTDERVSEWLRHTPTATPTKSSSSAASGKDLIVDDHEVDDFLPTPTRASLSTTRRKEKPTPISTSSGDASANSIRSASSAALPPIPTSPPLDFADPRSPRGIPVPQLSVSPPTSSSPERGRSASPIAVSSSTSTMPALSPTRTFSSATSESPRTPTVESVSLMGHARRSSVTSKASQSSEGAASGPSMAKPREEAKDLIASAVAAVIAESPAEDDARAEAVPGSRRPGKTPVTAEQAEQRRSGLFARRAELGPPPSKSAHTSASMSNLRKFSSKLSLRPKSVAVPESGRRDSTTSEDTVSPARSTRSSGVVHSSTMPIPRARKPLAPTMHDRGSILLQTGAIEDEESRRLSEMAFLY